MLELRRPLGSAIVGGLSVSLLLTLYTTPVIDLYMTRVVAGLSAVKAWVVRDRTAGASPLQAQ